MGHCPVQPVFADGGQGPGAVERQSAVVHGQFLRGLVVPETEPGPHDPGGGSIAQNCLPVRG